MVKLIGQESKDRTQATKHWESFSFGKNHYNNWLSQ